MPALCKSHFVLPFLWPCCDQSRANACRLSGTGWTALPGDHAVGDLLCNMMRWRHTDRPVSHQQQPQSRPGDRRHHQSLCCAAMVGGIP
ncbi:hypothetical protein BC831DRAFT_480468, partial [Entophlyctis helioformis]